MTTLTWLEATHGDPAHTALWDFLAEQVVRLAEERFEVRLRHTGVATGGIRNPANRLMSDAAVLAAALQAAPTSDALVIGCWGAPTAAVRSALGIPVTGLADASARAVAGLARRAVVITVAPALVPILSEDLRVLGATGFLPGEPVRSYRESDLGDVCRGVADPADLVERFDEVAERAVADGADAIVVGCGYLAPIFTAHGYTRVRRHPDVPVLDCNRLALSHVAQLLELQRNGIGPTARGYPRPCGDRAAALAASAALLTTAPPRGPQS